MPVVRWRSPTPDPPGWRWSGCWARSSSVPARGRRGRRPARPDRLPAAAVDSGDATTVIVRYRDGDVQRPQDRRTRARAGDRERSRPDGREVVRPARGRSVAETVEALLADPAVAYAEPNYPIQLAAKPDDRAAPGALPVGPRERWRRVRRDNFEVGCAVDVDIDAAAAWPVSTGEGVVVAVLDDGLDFTHPDSTPRRGRTQTTRRSTAWTTTGTASSMTSTGSTCARPAGPSTELHGAGEDFHGTAVASVIAAATDDTGMAGVAPDAEVMAVRWLINNKCMDTDMAAAAIEYAVDEGADVINASWGSEDVVHDAPERRPLRRGRQRPDRRRRGQRGRDQLLPGRSTPTPNVLVGRRDPADRLPRLVLEPRIVGRHGRAGQSILLACVSELPVGLRDRRRDVVRGAARRGGRGPAPRREARAARRRRLAAQQAHRTRGAQPEARRGLTTSGRRLNAAYALDVTAPSAPAVSVRAKLGSTIGTSSTAMAITWPASTDASGIESYRVRFRKTGTTTWTTIAGATTSRSATAFLTYSQPYELQVTARDRGANTTTTTVAFTPTRYTESSSLATYTGNWSLVESSSYQGGKARATTTAGRKVSYAITGRSIAWVAATGPTRGSAKIWVDGVYAGSVSLRASTTSYRKVVWSRSWRRRSAHGHARRERHQRSPARRRRRDDRRPVRSRPAALFAVLRSRARARAPDAASCVRTH